MLTVKDVARILNVSVGCVYALVDAGRIPHHRIGVGRGTLRISTDDLDRYLASCKKEMGEAVIARPPRLKLKHLKV
jgi:excisionase family DNA binding protein